MLTPQAPVSRPRMLQSRERQGRSPSALLPAHEKTSHVQQTCNDGPHVPRMTTRRKNRKGPVRQSDPGWGVAA